MKEPLLELRHATLGYGQRPVLVGVDFKVERGSFVGLLGHNGSGKTTILKTILGLIPCLKGALVIQGPAPLRFGYSPQKEALDPIYPLCAYDVAAMGTYRRFEPLARLRGLGSKAFVERCLADCGAAPLARKRYGDLSGGQKQRVLIARALAAEPEVLVLDEPLAGIDVTTQRSLIKLLKRLKEDRNLTVLMVSHRLRSEKGLFTHIAWCEDGEVLMGPTGEMLSGGRLSEVFEAEL